jgi:hypothetical protein
VLNDSRDRYLKSSDGKLATLKVQCPTSKPNDRVTWDRIDLKNETPLILWLAYWAIKPIPELAHGEWVKPGFNKAWQSLYLRWIPACFAIFASVCSLIRNSTNLRLIPTAFHTRVLEP